MKRKMIVVISSVLLIGLALASVAYAQSIPAFRYETLGELEESIDVDEEFETVCSGEIMHPVLVGLAEAYGVSYEELLVYFCEYEFGIGEIEHALATAELDDDYTYEDLLEWRYNEGEKDVGWGEIWQKLGLIGMGMDMEETEQESEDEFGENPICTGEMTHPVLNRLAGQYGVEYTDLLDYFCEQHFGIGEIKLALETALLEDVEMSYDEILGERSTGDQKDMGWGLIWKDLGLIGRGKPDNGETVELDETNSIQEQNENNDRKPAVPPGLSGGHPGKGRGPKK